MIEHREPPRWVTERGKCSISAKFDALAEIVERDVTEANALTPKLRSGRTFEYVERPDGIYRQFEVQRWKGSENEGGGIFRELEAAIGFVYHPSVKRTEYFIAPEWDGEESACVLRIEGEDRAYEVWEISQRFLGSLIFAP